MKLPQEDLLLPLVIQGLSKRYNLPALDGRLTSLNIEDALHCYKENPEVVSLLFARAYLLDNLFDNFYTEKILECLIEECNPLRGYFFKFDRDFLPKDFTFLRWKNLFFYPLFFGNLQELFLSLWKKDVPFVSAYSEPSTLNEISEVEDCLEVLSTLGFSRFTKKARERLGPVLRLQKEWLNLQTKEELSKLFFLVSSYPLAEEISEGVVLKDEGEEYYLVVRNFSSSLDTLMTTISLPQEAILGVIPGKKLEEEPFSSFSPFLLALSAFEHAKRAGLKVKEVDGFTLHVLADILLELEDLSFAKRVYEVAKEYTLQPVELTLSLASIYYTLGELDTAERLLRGKLCGWVKEDPMVHHNLGVVYLAKGRLPEAEYHLYKAFILDPENQILRQRLVQFLYELGRTSEILEILEDKEGLSPQEMLILGKIYFKQGDFDRALRLLSQLLNRPERDGEASLYLAWLYFNLRKNEEVAQVFLDDARSKLSKEEFERLRGELSL